MTQMSNNTILVQNICLRAKRTTKETGHANSDVVFVLPEVCLYKGVLHSSTFPDFIEDKKSGGQQQSNLFPVSAGSDLRMSPLRPNPYLSIGVEMRKSKFRGFFQLFSRSN
jgi:hypothetical protein